MDRGTDQGLFQQVIEQCKEPIMITDIEGNIIYVNAAWCNTYGYSVEMVIGQTPAILQSGLHDSQFYKKMWDSILDPVIHSWQGPLINKTRAGKHVPVHLTITHFYDQRGKSLGFMGIAMDMSHYSRLAEHIDSQSLALESTLTYLKNDLDQSYQVLAANKGENADSASMARSLKSHLDRMKARLAELEGQIDALG